MAAKKNQKVAAAKRKAAKPKSSVGDRIRLGETAYAVKQSSSRGDWRQIVRAAHDKGYTVSSALSDVPDDLKARTHSSLKTEATKSVSEAYAPQAAELDYQTQQAANIRTKRMSDENAYDQWAAQQTSQIAAASQKAQQDYQNFVDQQSGASQKAGEALAAQVQAQSQATASTDITGSTYLAGAKERLAAQSQSVANQAAAAHAAAPMESERGAALVAAQQGDATRARAGIEGDYGKSASAINSARLKMNSDRAAAVLSSYTSLLSKEIDKASANRDYEGLQASLNQKDKTAAQQHQEFLIGQKTTLSGQKLAASTTRRGQTLASRTAAAGQKLSSDDKAADRRARATNGRLDRASRESIAATNAASKALGDTNKRAQANTKITAVVDTIADILRTQQRGKAGKKGGNGYLWDPDQEKWLPARTALINRGATTPQINAGLAHARGRLLTPAEKAALGIVG